MLVFKGALPACVVSTGVVHRGAGRAPLNGTASTHTGERDRRGAGQVSRKIMLYTGERDRFHTLFHTYFIGNNANIGSMFA
jgi:hypothetical protein